MHMLAVEMRRMDQRCLAQVVEMVERKDRMSQIDAGTEVEAQEVRGTLKAAELVAGAELVEA